MKIKGIFERNFFFLVRGTKNTHIDTISGLRNFRKFENKFFLTEKLFLVVNFYFYFSE